MLRQDGACEALYGHVQTVVRRGVDALLQARRSDPYAEFAPRVAYEAAARRPAPTFAVDCVGDEWDAADRVEVAP